MEDNTTLISSVQLYNSTNVESVEEECFKTLAKSYVMYQIGE